MAQVPGRTGETQAFLTRWHASAQRFPPLHILGVLGAVGCAASLGWLVRYMFDASPTPGAGPTPPAMEMFHLVYGVLFGLFGLACGLFYYLIGFWGRLQIDSWGIHFHPRLPLMPRLEWSSWFWAIVVRDDERVIRVHLYRKRHAGTVARRDYENSEALMQALLLGLATAMKPMLVIVRQPVVLRWGRMLLAIGCLMAVGMPALVRWTTGGISPLELAVARLFGAASVGMLFTCTMPFMGRRRLLVLFLVASLYAAFAGSVAADMASLSMFQPPGYIFLIDWAVHFPMNITLIAAAAAGLLAGTRVFWPRSTARWNLPIQTANSPSLN